MINKFTLVNGRLYLDDMEAIDEMKRQQFELELKILFNEMRIKEFKKDSI